MLTDRGNPARVGDRVTFKAATRSHYRKATRVITRIDHWDRICVRYHGWDNFVIAEREILSIEEQENKPAPIRGDAFN